MWHIWESVSSTRPNFPRHIKFAHWTSKVSDTTDRNLFKHLFQNRDTFESNIHTSNLSFNLSARCPCVDRRFIKLASWGNEQCSLPTGSRLQIACNGCGRRGSQFIALQCMHTKESMGTVGVTKRDHIKEIMSFFTKKNRGSFLIDEWYKSHVVKLGIKLS